MEEVRSALGGADDSEDQIGALNRLRDCLKTMGVGEYCTLDMRIVRGLAYYTGIVYEVFDAGGALRAIAGGGRYDNLLEVLGGPKVGACGFGMGDVVLGILLQEKGKVRPGILAQGLDFYVIDDEGCPLETVMQVVGALRSKGASADFSYKRQPTGKQLKEANRRGAKRAVIVRPGNTVAVKDLVTGEQQDCRIEDILAGPR